MLDASKILDLDIWLAQRPDGRLCAYTHMEPRFLAISDDLDELMAEVRWSLRAYAQTGGHDLRFGLVPSYRPESMGSPPALALPVPVDGPARVTGRLVIGAVRDGEGRDPFGGELAGFLSRAKAPPVQGRRGRPRAGPR